MFESHTKSTRQKERNAVDRVPPTCVHTSSSFAGNSSLTFQPSFAQIWYDWRTIFAKVRAPSTSNRVLIDGLTSVTADIIREKEREIEREREREREGEREREKERGRERERERVCVCVCVREREREREREVPHFSESALTVYRSDSVSSTVKKKCRVLPAHETRRTFPYPLPCSRSIKSRMRVWMLGPFNHA